MSRLSFKMAPRRPRRQDDAPIIGVVTALFIFFCIGMAIWAAVFIAALRWLA